MYVEERVGIRSDCKAFDSLSSPDEFFRKSSKLKYPLAEPLSHQGAFFFEPFSRDNLEEGKTGRR